MLREAEREIVLEEHHKLREAIEDQTVSQDDELVEGDLDHEGDHNDQTHKDNHQS